MNRLLNVAVDPWPDLVYHALSYLPIPATDASTIFSGKYVAWAELGYSEISPAIQAVPRSLPADAAVLAALYMQSSHGFMLHSLPRLWGSLDEFCGDIARYYISPAVQQPTGGKNLSRNAAPLFDRILWKPSQAALAASIQRLIQPILPELFCLALWAELKNGYPALWQERTAPRSLAYREQFVNGLLWLSERLPGLREVRWCLSHPLRVHGRCLQMTAGAPIIVVGVADQELGVSDTHPIIQACHEYFVSQTSAQTPGQQLLSTVPGQAGYARFVREETAALELGRQFFTGSSWEPAYREWRANSAHPSIEHN